MFKFLRMVVLSVMLLLTMSVMVFANQKPFDFNEKQVPRGYMYLCNDSYYDVGYSLRGFYIKAHNSENWSENLLTEELNPNEISDLIKLPVQSENLDLKFVFPDAEEICPITCHDLYVVEFICQTNRQATDSVSYGGRTME